MRAHWYRACAAQYAGVDGYMRVAGGGGGGIGGEGGIDGYMKKPVKQRTAHKSKAVRHSYAVRTVQ